MLDNSGASFPLRLLNLAAYLTMAAIGVAGLASLPPDANRWVAFGLLIVFGLLFVQTVDAVTKRRPRRVLAGLALQTAAVTGLSLLNLSSPSATNYLSMFFFMLSAEVMLLLPQRTAVAWIVLFALATGAIFVYGEGLESGIRTAIVNGAGYFFFGAFGAALRQVQTAHQTSARLLDELKVAHRQLREYADRVERMAIVEERNRLARELHDLLGHRLTVAAVQLEGAQRLIAHDPSRAAKIVETVREQVRDALGELRRTVATLRQPEQLDLALSPAIDQLATAFEQATGIAVRRVFPNGLPELPLAHRLTLYRAAQEGLTNVQRHAQAKNALLVLSSQPGTVTLTVSDDGVGYPVTRPAGYGLLGVKERAALLGGELRLENRPEGGAQLTLTLPCPGPTKEPHE